MDRPPCFFLKLVTIIALIQCVYERDKCPGPWCQRSGNFLGSLTIFAYIVWRPSSLPVSQRTGKSLYYSHELFTSQFKTFWLVLKQCCTANQKKVFKKKMIFLHTVVLNWWEEMGVTSMNIISTSQIISFIISPIRLIGNCCFGKH